MVCNYSFTPLFCTRALPNFCVPAKEYLYEEFHDLRGTSCEVMYARGYFKQNQYIFVGYYNTRIFDKRNEI